MFRISKNKNLMIIVLGLNGMTMLGSQHRRVSHDLSYECAVLQETGNSLKKTQDMLISNQRESSASERLVLLSAYCIDGASCADVMSKALTNLQEVTFEMTNLLDVHLHCATKNSEYDLRGVSFRRIPGQPSVFGDAHEQILKVVQDALSSSRRLRDMMHCHEPRFSEVVRRAHIDSSCLIQDVTLGQCFLPLILKQRTAAEHLNFVLWRIVTQA